MLICILSHYRHYIYIFGLDQKIMLGIPNMIHVFSTFLLHKNNFK